MLETVGKVDLRGRIQNWMYYEPGKLKDSQWAKSSLSGVRRKTRKASTESREKAQTNLRNP